MLGLKNTNHIVIHGWMINELDLKGNELIIYSIIYGFSQDGESNFSGSLQYLANWTNTSKEGVRKNLLNLIDKGLIIKENIEINGVNFCKYKINLDKLTVSKKVDGIQQSCINNIVYKEKEIYNKLYISKKKENFDKFWKAYPKKKSKGQAEKWFDKINPSEELIEIMINKINLLKNTKQWKDNDGQFIPYPITWLNSKGWEDEISVENNTSVNNINDNYIDEAGFKHINGRRVL